MTPITHAASKPTTDTGIAKAIAKTFLPEPESEAEMGPSGGIWRKKGGRGDGGRGGGGA